MINKQYIREKAEKLKKKGISLDYSDYLNIFLLIRGEEKLNYRSMDLIQSHIRFEYDTRFSLSDCCFGYGADVEFIPAPEKNIQSYVQHAEICYR